MLAIFEIRLKVGRNGRTGGQGQTSKAKCSPFFSKAKGRLAIFEIQQKVVSDGRAGRARLARRNALFFSKAKGMLAIFEIK